MKNENWLVIDGQRVDLPEMKIGEEVKVNLSVGVYIIKNSKHGHVVRRIDEKYRHFDFKGNGYFESKENITNQEIDKKISQCEEGVARCNQAVVNALSEGVKQVMNGSGTGDVMYVVKVRNHEVAGEGVEIIETVK